MDFDEFLQNDIVRNKEIEKMIMSMFGNKEKEKIFRQSSVSLKLRLDKNDSAQANQEMNEGIQRDYYQIDKHNKVSFSNVAFLYDIDEYSNYVEHISEFKKIISLIYRIHRITSSRIGIRYINIYEPDKIIIRKKYFSPNVAALLETKLPLKLTDNLKLVRRMEKDEYQLNNMKLNFRYGMYNPEYPNIIKKNTFVLDFDAFSEVPIDSDEEIFGFLNQGHDAIQILFEKSITDSLRHVMNS